MNSLPHSGAPALVSGRPVEIGRARRILAEQFRRAGIATPELDARLLVCHGCGATHEQLALDPRRMLAEREVRRVEELAQRRLSREPVSRIVGKREFRGLDFELGPETLDPRPDTETLVEAALEIAHAQFPDQDISVLDLGTGSGCILVSLLHALPKAHGVGTDISRGALELARRNAASCGVGDRAEFVCTKWSQGLEQGFHLVVSNPPYIPSREIDRLDPEVSRFDPRRALDGGDDGLGAYREIIASLDRVLMPGGWALFEVGLGRDEMVLDLLRDGLGELLVDEVRLWQDLSGKVRCVGAKRSPKCD